MPEPAEPLFIRVNGVVEESVVDGPGLRYSVFTQGCFHGCPGCHNPDTHSLDGGYLLAVDEVVRTIGKNPLLAGVTFSGGEPFLQPEPLCHLAREVRAMGLTVMTYTGFTYEELSAMGRVHPYIAELLEWTDILVDGPYREELRDLELKFRGSSNQRLLTREDRAALELD